MLCRNPDCKAELVPDMVSDLGSDEEYQFKLNGELVWRCPEGCRLNQCETASKQKAMREKPKPKFVRGREKVNRKE